MGKAQKEKNSPKNVDGDKITSPVNYPSHRSKKGSVAIPSQNNVEISRDWIEINKL